MEIKLTLIVLLLGIFFTGLTAGLCFTWSSAVTKGLGRLDNLSFLKAFKSINRVIINGPFIIVFFGPIILLFLNAYLYNSSSISFWIFLGAAIVFFIGVGLVTVLGNIPLNEILEKSDLDSLSNVEVQELRFTFEQPWNRWHKVRTFSSSCAFLLLIIGMLYSH